METMKAPPVTTTIHSFSSSYVETSYKLVASYLCCQHICRDIFIDFPYPQWSQLWMVSVRREFKSSYFQIFIHIPKKKSICLKFLQYCLYENNILTNANTLFDIGYLRSIKLIQTLKLATNNYHKNRSQLRIEPTFISAVTLLFQLSI